jgi:hypothetical protein
LAMVQQSGLDGSSADTSEAASVLQLIRQLHARDIN